MPASGRGGEPSHIVHRSAAVRDLDRHSALSAVAEHSPRYVPTTRNSAEIQDMLQTVVVFFLRYCQ